MVHQIIGESTVIEIVCQECEAKNDLMALLRGKMLCFRCLAKKDPDAARQAVEFLTVVMGIKAGRKE